MILAKNGLLHSASHTCVGLDPVLGLAT